jgi:hypothetical protein
MVGGRVELDVIFAVHRVCDTAACEVRVLPVLKFELPRLVHCLVERGSDGGRLVQTGDRWQNVVFRGEG